jgi:predicted kinase
MSKLKVIVVCGLPGSGKSTTAEGVSKKLGYPTFSVDPIESAVIKSGIKRSFETGLAAYLVAQTLADEQLRLSHSVIIDAVNAVPEGKQMWRDLAKKYNAKLVLVECHASDEKVHKQRVEARVRNIQGIPEVTWSDVGKRKEEYVEWEEPVLRLDALDNPEANVDKAIGYINNQ